MDTTIIACHDVVAAGLTQLLEEPSGGHFRVLGPGATRTPGLILYEVEGAGRGGSHDLRLHRLLTRTTATVIAIYWDETSPAVAAALGCGAHGTVSLKLPAEEFGRSIERIRGGSTCVPPPAPREVAACDVEVARCGLTARELEILGLIADGLSNQEIAELLFVSINTVKSHVRTAYRKIGVGRRSQAVKWAAVHGVGRPEQLAHERTLERSGLRPSCSTQPRS